MESDTDKTICGPTIDPDSTIIMLHIWPLRGHFSGSGADRAEHGPTAGDVIWVDTGECVMKSVAGRDRSACRYQFMGIF